MNINRYLPFGALSIFANVGNDMLLIISMIYCISFNVRVSFETHENIFTKFQKKKRLGEFDF